LHHCRAGERAENGFVWYTSYLLLFFLTKTEHHFSTPPPTKQAKSEFDKLAELKRLQSDLAFDSALADINRAADDFEEELRLARERNEAAAKEQELWERDVEVARSQGQFFQTLYQSDKKKPVGEDAERLRERVDRVVEPARQEVRSPLRFYLFTCLAGLLVLELAGDLVSNAPSAVPDLLYISLAGLAAFLAVNERRALGDDGKEK
jgi:chaperonin cofactor prefoldin